MVGCEKVIFERADFIICEKVIVKEQMEINYFWSVYLAVALIWL